MNTQTSEGQEGIWLISNEERPKKDGWYQAKDSVGTPSRCHFINGQWFSYTGHPVAQWYKNTGQQQEKVVRKQLLIACQALVELQYIGNSIAESALIAINAEDKPPTPSTELIEQSYHIYKVHENEKVSSFLMAILRELDTDEIESLSESLIARLPPPELKEGEAREILQRLVDLKILKDELDYVEDKPGVNKYAEYTPKKAKAWKDAFKFLEQPPSPELSREENCSDCCGLGSVSKNMGIWRVCKKCNGTGKAAPSLPEVNTDFFCQRNAEGKCSNQCSYCSEFAVRDITDVEVKEETISDGFGSIWSAYCPECGRERRCAKNI